MKVAIASGKSGTGKTTLAVNLAAYMAESERVILADLDVEEPSSSFFLQGETEHREVIYTHVPQWDKELCNFCGLCQKVCNFHAVLAITEDVMVFPELCHGCYVCSELCPAGALPMVPHRTGELRHLNTGHLHFVEGKLDIGQEQAVPVINRTIDYLDDYFEELDITTILDSPPGTAYSVVAATQDADFVILVTEPTPLGLHDLSLAVDVMRDLEKETAVVVNRYGLGNDDVLDFCETSSIPVIAKFPNDRQTAALYSRGELIYPEIGGFRVELEKVRASVHEHTKGAVL